MTKIQKDLFKLRDEKYKAFLCPLIPTVHESSVIGIRTPELRAYAKKIYGTNIACAFLKNLPHEYYEENNLHAFLLERIKNFDIAVDAVDTFLPFIDNWATCDGLNPKVFASNTDKLLSYIDIWLKSDYPYTVRFGIKMLMNFFLDGKFKYKYHEKVMSVSGDDYYIKMMVAWYFATALSKQYESTVSVFESKKLSKWTHNKAIQKALESYRISDEHKAYLRTLKVKN